MRIAHFGIFGPHLSGQYETVKELILAERKAGIEAEFIDFGDKGKLETRLGLKDDYIETQPIEWALKADFAVRHSEVPLNVRAKVPVITALHGRPENSFLLEYYKRSPIITEIKKSKGPFFTFWEELVYPWEVITGEKVHLVQAPVDLEKYNPEGFKHQFGAGPNIIITDIWREDTTPFNVLMASCMFKDKFCKKARIHIYGAPKEELLFKILGGKEYFGEIMGQVSGLKVVYRAADMLVTPQVIATRTVREALASGLPVVAGTGNRYTTYTANPRDVEGFAKKINDCWNHQQIHGKEMRNIARRTAEIYFNAEKTAADVKKMIDEISTNL